MVKASKTSGLFLKLICRILLVYLFDLFKLLKI